MNSITYQRLTTILDVDIPRLWELYTLPEISRFISIAENYFTYVTTTESVRFFKIFLDGQLVGAVHLEMPRNVLFMDIALFPEHQGKGIGTRVLKDVVNGSFGLNFDCIEVSIDENNLHSINLFEGAGFVFKSRDAELLNYVYTPKKSTLC